MGSPPVPAAALLITRRVSLSILKRLIAFPGAVVVMYKTGLNGLQTGLMVLLACALTLLIPQVTKASPLPFQQESALQLTPFTSSVKVGHQIRYLATDAIVNPAALSTVPEDQWEHNTAETISLGFQTQPYWFVVDVTTAQDISRYWVLELTNALIDDVAVYLYRDQQLVGQWHTGDQYPFNQRPVDSPRFVFPFELQGNAHYQIAMRVASSEALELPLTLTERFTHAVMSDRRSLVDGIFHGFLIIMAAYSLAIFVILRDKSYLFYGCYVLSMLAFFLSQQGLLFEYFFPAYPLLQHYSVPLVSMLIFFAIAFFFESFLDINRQTPHLWWCYRVQLLIHLGLCVALTFMQYQVVVSIMALNVAVSMVVGITAVSLLSYRGSQSALIVMVGWGVLFLFIMLFVLARTGFFYNDFLASYGMRIGISLEILIFSFALSFRINLERKEKEWALNKINSERTERIRAQELALEREIEARQAKEASLQMEIEHRESLQQLVDERTADLERTLFSLEKANLELEQLSTRDALTGLFNRRLFDSKLAEHWQVAQNQGQLLGLLIIDVDHFKQVNDTWGHPCGDMVLREMAQLLSSVIHRPTDVIARYGGEEIAVLMPNTPLEGAKHVADLIVRAAAAKIYVWEGTTFSVTVSIGVHALSPTQHQMEQVLVTAADHALYQAKQTGRNRAVCYQQAGGLNVASSH